MRTLRLGRLRRACRAVATVSAWFRARAIVAVLLTRGTAFFLANAFHHFLAGSACGRRHHVAARWFADTAPQSLATHGNRFSAFVRCRTEALDLFNRDGLTCEFFNFFHKTFLVQGHQTDCFPTGTGATGAADAVHIVFADIRNFVIHHMRQIVNVDAARRDIGGYQHTDVAALETGERLRAGGLAFVAVQRHGGDALFVQKLCHVVGTKLGAAKHQHLAPLLALDDMREQRFFLAAAHRVNHLRDQLHRGVFRRDLNALRVMQKLCGQVANFLAEGGREQQALFVLGYQRQHFFHVMDKTHVEHAVGFVKHQNLHGG